METILALRSRQFLVIGSTISPMSSSVLVCLEANREVPPVSLDAEPPPPLCTPTVESKYEPIKTSRTEW